MASSCYMCSQLQTSLARSSIQARQEQTGASVASLSPCRLSPFLDLPSSNSTQSSFRSPARRSARPVCQAEEPNQGAPAVDARAPTSILSPATPLPSAATTEAVPAPGTEWINFNLDKRSPITPPEWEDKVKKQKEEKAAKMQTSIRRRPPTGPPTHAVGPFEFKIENEDNLPRNILEEIVWNKDVEVQKAKEKTPLGALKRSGNPAPPLNFVEALRERAAETGVPGLIAEVKKASPSKGLIQPNFNPVLIARAYEAGGAACLSVLTDEKYFQGSFDNIVKIRASGSRLPILCKEFIIDAYQIFKARMVGADAVLLIAAVLPDVDLIYMSKIAKSLGMQALLEVHTLEEMDRVLGIDGVQMIGINNRDLSTFKTDIHNTARLLEGGRGEQIRERNILLVGESALATPEDIAIVQKAGVGAVLVGESLVKQANPTEAIAGLFGKDISRKQVEQ
ncbi:indole-3-glycerol phosphate synthase [Klebsormidium nitens]|uniref:indole-3-glycerol-phosphate synthase n=1 Tax=Klebsormidium nitens TaxID=105231 RepID=A0A1Y1IB26_KLENI|nr:indole-3-glycerol phosphate synthase [Klebsormidium nitens]|eukprot:GAQ88120.1 indole-3-glycerol phosphate synthase [Klebsormidium nitens]